MNAQADRTRSPQTLGPKGAFTLTFDFELAWGSRDLYADLAPLEQAARTTREVVLPKLLEMLDATGIVGTWATVGHLFLDGAQTGPRGMHPDLVPPSHAWHPGPWLAGVPAGDEATHPEYYGRSLVQDLVARGHEVGSHSFTHPIFGDPGCPRQTADTELARCVTEAETLGLSLRSFVFPRNVVGHRDLLARHGFTCWRGPEPVWYRGRWTPGPLARAAHLTDVFLASDPPTVVPVRDEHGLWEIPASASCLPMAGVRRLVSVPRRVRRCVRGLELAADQRRLFHLWLHPINLADAPGPMLQSLQQVCEHAARLRDAGRIDVLTMGQLAERAQARHDAA